MGWLGHEIARDLDVEALREHRAERLDLHLAEAGQRADALAEVLAVGGLRPDARRVAAVVLDDGRGELVHARRHRAGEAVDRGLLPEERLEVGLRDLLRIERPEPLLESQRAEERLLHRDLLVEREADEQRERIGREQPARLLVLGEPERLGHPRILRRGLHTSAAALDVRRCALLFEVGQRGLDARRVAALGGEQTGPRLGETGSDPPIQLGAAG